MNEEQKPLSEILKETLHGVFRIDEACYRQAVDAVIAEHERRKAEQANPDQFAAEKAAFAEGKTIQCFSESRSEWFDCDQHPPNWYSDFKYRVKPEPVEPEQFAAEKAAFDAGKTIQYFSGTHRQWFDCDKHPPFWFPDSEYRVKPEPVQVELGPDDVPIGSEFMDGEGLRLSYQGIGSSGVQFYRGHYPWSVLSTTHYKINRNDGKGWVPCSKNKPE